EPVQQQPPPPSLHNIQHSTLTTEPSPFNNTQTTPKQTFESYKYIKQQPTNNFTSLNHHSGFPKYKEEKKFVIDLVAISDPVVDFVEKQKRHVTESLTTTPSTEKKVVRAIPVAETIQQHRFFILQLLDFPINLFDPGGTTTAFDFNPRDWFAEFLNPYFVVFDPGGDEYRFRSSPTSI
ncbi:hypothetical protein A2U01_0033050, partial [Trifolium medium]|nr:hypothetical protein [Trifolium medium]